MGKTSRSDDRLPETISAVKCAVFDPAGDSCTNDAQFMLGTIAKTSTGRELSRMWLDIGLCGFHSEDRRSLLQMVRSPELTEVMRRRPACKDMDETKTDYVLIRPPG